MRRNVTIMLPLALCLGGSLAINLLQGTRILSLQSDIQQLLARGDLLPGTPFPALQAKDLTGQPFVVEARSFPKPTILYVFTPSCGWCLRNNENVKLLAGQVSANYRVLGLSLSRTGLQEYVKAHNITFPVYTDVQPTVLASFRLGRTPETIVISPDGTVIQSWAGAYVGGVKTALERYFSIRLPTE